MRAGAGGARGQNFSCCGPQPLVHSETLACVLADTQILQGHLNACARFLSSYVSKHSRNTCKIMLRNTLES